MVGPSPRNRLRRGRPHLSFMHQTAHVVMPDAVRQKVKTVLNDTIDKLMKMVVFDELMLLQVVLGGPYHWRLNVMREYAVAGMTDTLCDLMFHFFAGKVVERYGSMEDATKALDSIEVASPPTDQEIEDSWVHECSSSEEARRMFYKDGNPTVKQRPIIVSSTVH